MYQHAPVSAPQQPLLFYKSSSSLSSADITENKESEFYTKLFFPSIVTFICYLYILVYEIRNKMEQYWNYLWSGFCLKICLVHTYDIPIKTRKI